MRIYHETTQHYINALATCISKDPASLESWRCLHIHPSHLEPVNEAIVRRIKEEHTDIDCDVVLCADGDMLLISRELDTPAFQNLAAVLTSGMMNDAPEVELYDLFRDWRAIRELLLSKQSPDAAQEPAIDMSQKSTIAFGEVEALADVFGAAKSLRQARRPQHVLLVEDDPLTRRIVANSFKQNYAVITAHNAQEAVANYLMYAPDVVFLDIGLPDGSGFDVLKQIVASDPDAYVVMFSGSSYLDNITRAINAGAAGFIAKPFKREKLQSYIDDSAMHHHKASA